MQPLKSFSTIAILAITVNLYSQILPKSIEKDLKKENQEAIREIYNTKLDNPDCFINGCLYIPKGNNYDHPYFNSNDWEKGQIAFNNKPHEVPFTKYDIEADALIILKRYGINAYPIQLQESLVKEFYINKHHFTKVQQLPKSGYYENVYANNNYQILIKWKKRKSAGKAGIVQNQYTESFQITFKKDDEYYKIRSLSKLYKILGSKKKELKTYKNMNQLVFSEDKISTIIYLTDHHIWLTENE